MVYILLAEGFEELEAVAPADILRRGGVPVSFVGIGGMRVAGSHQITVSADAAIENVRPKNGDAVVIPGGLKGVENIKASGEASRVILEAAELGCVFGAICAGPRALHELGLLEGVHVTGYPGSEAFLKDARYDSAESTVRDGKIVTGRAAGSAFDFGLALLEVLAGGETASEVRSDLVYEG